MFKTSWVSSRAVREIIVQVHKRMDPEVKEYPSQHEGKDAREFLGGCLCNWLAGLGYG